MDDRAATDLEAAIADVGRLLVQLQKYREAAAVHQTLLGAALTLGDRARAGHHRQTLDAPSATALVGEVAMLRGRAAAALAAVHGSGPYREAVRAHATADFPTLGRLLPVVFADLETVGARCGGFTSVPWLRRGRPRPAADLAAEIACRRAEGLAGEGAPDAPGSDPELPAVVLAAEPPPGEPLVLAFPADVLPPVLFRLSGTDEILVHVPRLLARFRVCVPAALDDDAVGEATLHWEPYRAALVEALAAAGEAVEG